MQSSRDAEDVRIERRAELPSSSGTGSGGAMGVVGPMGGSGPLKKRHHLHSRATRRRKDGMMDNGVDKRGLVESPRSSGSVKQSATGSGASVGAGRLSKTAISSSLSSSSSSPNAPSSASSPPGGCSAVFYVVLVSLILLLCTNGFLFSKIWALEQLAEELARHPPSCLSAANMADLRVLTSVLFHLFDPFYPKSTFSKNELDLQSPTKVTGGMDENFTPTRDSVSID